MARPSHPKQVVGWDQSIHVGAEHLPMQGKYCKLSTKTIEKVCRWYPRIWKILVVNCIKILGNLLKRTPICFLDDWMLPGHE